MLVAGLIGITLSVPLQAPAVILLGVAATCAAPILLAGLGRKVDFKWLLMVSILAFVYFILRAVVSPVRDLGIQDLMLILPAGLLYIIAGYCVSGKIGVRFRQGLASVVILLLLLHLGSALLQLAGSDGYSLSRYLASTVPTSGNRITGMYTYYGSFANFMVIAGLLCLSLGGWGRFSNGVRAILFICGVLALGLVVWSQSRSAAVSLVVSIAVLAVLFSVSLAHQRATIKRRANIIISILGGLGLLGCIAGGVWVFNNRALDGSTKATEMVFDSGVRMPFWAMAADQWTDHPIVGAGSRSYSYLANKYWSPNLPTGEASPVFVHNEYLQLLADYGLVGLLLILLLLAWHLLLGVQRIRVLSQQVGDEGIIKGSNALALALAGVSGMVAMAVHITFDFRTHLLANLLLLVCCAVWILPVVKSKSSEVLETRHRGGLRWFVALALFVIGAGSIYLGSVQLWGGMPLIEQKITKEDGAWLPQAVSRDQWIPALEQAVARAPDFNRYQRLATLYQIEAIELSGLKKKKATEQAKAAYLLSIERNGFNPVPWINLAAMYTEEKRFEQADDAFSKASEMAKSRERWFRMHSYWGRMHQDWAVDYWQKQNQEQAEEHFLRAKELYKLSYDYAYFFQNKQWVVEYTQLLITYARFLDGQKKYDEAELLFQEGRKQVNWYNWQVDTKLNFYYGKHFYERGKYVWLQRKPEQAFEMMKKAKAQLLQHKAMMKSDVEAGYDEQLAKIQKVIDFLEQTGIK